MTREVVTSVLSSKAEEHIIRWRCWVRHSNSTTAELLVTNNGRSSISLLFLGFVCLLPLECMNIYKDLLELKPPCIFGVSCSLLDLESATVSHAKNDRLRWRPTQLVCTNISIFNASFKKIRLRLECLLQIKGADGFHQLGITSVSKLLSFKICTRLLRK